MLKAIGYFFLDGIKEAGMMFLATIALIAIIAFYIGPFFGFAYLADTYHPAWAYIGWPFWLIVMAAITKRMEG